MNGDPDGLPGRVLLVEPVGSDTFLNVETAEKTIVKVRVPASSRAREGDSVRIRLRAEDIHLFDAEGVRIDPAIETEA
jgi:ABC-type sugar transport system ATPase subunit